MKQGQPNPGQAVRNGASSGSVDISSWLTKASPGLFAAVLGLIYLASLVAYAPRTRGYIPYIDTYDEFQVFWNSMHMLQFGTPFTDHFFGRGHFAVYLALFTDVLLQALGRVPSTDPTFIGVVPRPDYEFSLGFDAFLVTNRMLWVALVLTAVIAIALICRTLVGPTPALAAAIVLAANPFLSNYVVRIEADGLAMALAAWCQFFALHYRRVQQPWALWLSTIFAGLAFSTKWTYGCVFLSTLAVVWITRGNSWRLAPGKLRRLFPFSIIFVVVILVTTPSILRFPVEFAQQVGFQIFFYQTADGFSGRGLPQLLFQLQSLLDSFGLLALVLATIGLISVFLNHDTRRPATILLLGYAPTLAILLISQVNFHRNWLLIYPFLALLVSVGIYRVARLTSKLPALRRWTKSAFILTFGGLLLFVVYSPLSALTEPHHVSKDTRTKAMSYVWSHACRLNLDVAVDEMLLLNGSDRSPLCSGSSLREVPRIALLASERADQIAVLCIDDTGSFPPADNPGLIFEPTETRRGLCRDSLNSLWNNPPMLDPTVQVIVPRRS